MHPMPSYLSNLMSRKQEIEKDIAETGELLGPAGMSEPLVDKHGFPRADVDVYAVRTARAKLIALRNDYSSVLDQLEKGLAEWYE